ncbi:Sucraseferredoxin-like protein [Corchorus olitorius]|uniref:Sucraseferredoxin-like protein n=1 Tax=Corchorus olitorius TaxID=93759 RepID=A0A1R3KIV9_9ROSI|nr:Sucraseferredoxin-like protein [Corchorus olitorius]
MSSSRERDDPLSFPTNPSSSSSPITVSDHLDSYLQDPTSHIGSASGSYSNEGLLASAETASPSNSDVEFGFSRPDFRQQTPISGTVQFYERHVFLCYKNPSVWPPRIEAAEFDRLPRLLSAAVLARKSDMKKETRLTICEGHDGTETSNGDVLIFPDMIRYRRLTHFDVDTFVEEVLVKDGEWLPGTPERLEGSYVFVCSHGSRDRRCGVCGPPLISRFREEIESYGLQGRVSVSPCSHIGGHKYAGNVIIFGNINGEVTGHWYGYVTQDDVPMLLEWHIGKGEIIDSLWRGQMGLSEDEQKKYQELRCLVNGETTIQGSAKEATQRQIDEVNTTSCRAEDEVANCCQGNGNASCCREPALPETLGILDTNEGAVKLTPEKKKGSKRQISKIPSGKAAIVRKIHEVDRASFSSLANKWVEPSMSV